MTFYTGVGIRKQYVEVPSLPAWLRLNRSEALLLMARYASSQDTQLQSHGKYLCTNYGKGTFNENCMFTFIVLVRWPRYSVQLAYWLLQKSFFSYLENISSTYCNCTKNVNLRASFKIKEYQEKRPQETNPKCRLQNIHALLNGCVLIYQLVGLIIIYLLIFCLVF